MNIDQLLISNDLSISPASKAIVNPQNAQLVFVFGDTPMLEDTKPIYNLLHNIYPNAQITFSSTSGNIAGINLYVDKIAVTAIEFEKTSLKFYTTSILNSKDTINIYKDFVNQIDSSNLKSIILLSDGQKVNGTELIKAFNTGLPDKVIVTGGLAGDGSRFKKTVVGLNENVGEGNLVAICLYGDSLKVATGCQGGWEPFGPKRKITKSKGNIVYEFDYENALALYKRYLGDKVSELPASGLLFPLSIESADKTQLLVRTILNINEEDQSLIFAGDIPEGSYVHMMKVNFDNLVGGGWQAAEDTLKNNSKPELAFVVSCVGRRLVLGGRVEEELEAIQDVLGSEVKIAGFYSYGEFCPILENKYSELHNQTMTITTFSEE